jgi:hypothetical protein
MFVPFEIPHFIIVFGLVSESFGKDPAGKEAIFLSACIHKKAT